jgi:hypothetical protein
LPKEKNRNQLEEVEEDYEGFIEYEDDEEEPQVTHKIDEPVDAHGKAIYLNPPHDTLINAEIQLQIDGKMDIGKVTRRAIGPDGTTAGTYDSNPMLNSMIHEVEFPDEQKMKEYAAMFL